ncbi:hypothetical protein GCM10023147_10030 [Tsukamurella soli]|uniref:Uncharacterized protein n=1 Tax=Tsukamurella soli TaxID=644556 RepID=A0ABP8J7W2_9ACTN
MRETPEVKESAAGVIGVPLSMSGPMRSVCASGRKGDVRTGDAISRLNPATGSQPRSGPAAAPEKEHTLHAMHVTPRAARPAIAPGREGSPLA